MTDQHRPVDISTARYVARTAVAAILTGTAADRADAACSLAAVLLDDETYAAAVTHWASVARPALELDAEVTR